MIWLFAKILGLQRIAWNFAMTVEVLSHRNAKSPSIFFLTHQNRASPFLGHDTTPIAGKAMAPPTSTLDKYATRLVSAFWREIIGFLCNFFTHRVDQTNVCHQCNYFTQRNAIHPTTIIIGDLWNTELDILWLSWGNFQSPGSILTNDTSVDRGGPWS